ncbi:Uncharacterized protein FWK35_00022951 [Aphis craccivora]|uniref:Uncharacterized protein n=1 Tax=Aphis craccivora TaxID=307492 RepID=A0A6G0W4C3_APHCR|nr:Uncharacterized protein FWK35_00022951 [Aphis craccivora]
MNLNQDIEQVTLISNGHTIMEVDSVHSTLEHYFKPPLYSPSDYITRMRMARPNQPPSSQNIQYKTNTNDDCENLPITTKNQVTTYVKNVPNLYTAQLPITKAKYEDLQSLKQAIEKDHHSFYDNLKYTEHIIFHQLEI